MADRKSRRIVGSLSLALAAGTAAVAATAQEAAPTDVERIIADNAASQAALLRGDVQTFAAKIGGLSHDFVLMAPMGGEPSHAAEYTPDRMARMGRFFRNGTLEQEVVATYASPDMIVLATIERTQVEVGRLPRQPWSLRVTSVFVRRGSGWQLAHRHADPLVEAISVEESARLARGKRSPAN